MHRLSFVIASDGEFAPDKSPTAGAASPPAASALAELAAGWAAAAAGAAKGGLATAAAEPAATGRLSSTTIDAMPGALDGRDFGVKGTTSERTTDPDLVAIGLEATCQKRRIVGSTGAGSGPSVG